jgi:hypothetical protein
MNKKIPADAFSFYVSLGPRRSYDAVAAKYGASRRGVADHAKREHWQERVAKLETRARADAETKAAESLEAMNQRHLQEARFLQSRGLEGLKSGRLELYAANGRLVELGVKLERLVRGQATERTESLEQVVRGEYARWFSGQGDAADSEEGSDSDVADAGDDADSDTETDSAADHAAANNPAAAIETKANPKAASTTKSTTTSASKERQP